MRILFVTTRFPLPPWRGQQVRTVEWVKALAEHELSLVCPACSVNQSFSQSEIEGVKLFTYRSSAVRRALALAAGGLKGRPLQEALYRTPEAISTIGETLTDQRPELVVIQMVRCAWALDVIASVAPEVPVLFDAIDAMGLHYDRAARSMSWPVRALALGEAVRCSQLERKLVSAAAMVTAVSRRDLESLGADEDAGRVIPVSGSASRLDRVPAEKPTVLLSGNLGYRPTVEACRWVARSVWPEIKKLHPAARWVIAGARPHRTIRQLNRLPGIEVHGDVASLDPFLSEAWVALAPMASGSGVPMKVLEAWAAGVPVVAREWAARGLEEGVRPAVAVADDAPSFVNALNRLLDSRQERDDLASKGRVAWRNVYHPEVIAQKIRDAVEVCVG